MIPYLDEQPMNEFEAVHAETGLIGVASRDVPYHWPMVKLKLEKAIDRAPFEYSSADVLTKLMEGTWHLWVSRKSVGITCIKEYPQGRTCLCLYGAGELNDMLRCFDGIADWAATMGCTAMDVIGRPGWGKALASRGYREKYRTFHVKL